MHPLVQAPAAPDNWFGAFFFGSIVVASLVGFGLRGLDKRRARQRGDAPTTRSDSAGAPPSVERGDEHYLHDGMTSRLWRLAEWQGRRRRRPR